MRKVAGYLVGATAFLAAATGTVSYSETAAVRVSVPTQREVAQTTILGSPSSVDLPTTTLTVQVTDSKTGIASPAAIPTFAAGAIVFTGYSACTQQCGGGEFMIPTGTTVATLAGIGYVTLAEADFPMPGTSKPIPIRAKVAGPTGNTGAGTVVFMPSNHSMGVTNPKPITGGAIRHTQVISTADMETLTGVLAGDLLTRGAAELKSRAGGMGYALTALPDIAPSADHRVGDEVATFTVTITVTMNAIAFSDTRVRTMIVSALQSRLPPSLVLSPASVHTSYYVEGIKPDGSVVIAGTGVGFVMPSISVQTMRERLARLTTGEARDELTRLAPGSTVYIRTTPANMPWLPVLPSRITLTVEPLA